MHIPRISGLEVDLYKLYSEVTERGGFNKINQRDEWDDILRELGLPERCVNATTTLKYIYRRCLEKYERQNFFGEDPDKFEALESVDAIESGGRSRSRYPSTYSSTASNVAVNSVPMSYNYRQHIVNMDRRRTYKLSTDLYKASPYEKILLSLISPLPNEQDFAINVCSLMANESKHTLKLNEYPKILDILLAHTGVFADYTLRALFQNVYIQARGHSLFEFWRDLLRDKPQILEMYTDQHVISETGLVNEELGHEGYTKKLQISTDSNELNFLNLGRTEGTQEYVGQRVQQIVAIFRNLSFFEENLTVFAKNRTFIRFIVMGANIRWGNLHNQILDIAGNIATEIELLDPSTDDVSRNLLATVCDGVESSDRGVVINSLEILYKLCQKDINGDHINKCLNLKFYETIFQFLCLNDMMLLIFTLEAIYALTSMGTRSCHLIMQVRGIIDQLVSLITVEAQSYGPDGCIMMRVVETVPGNMLPMVAQNIANLQSAVVIQQNPSAQAVFSAPATAFQLPTLQPPVPTPVLLPPPPQISAAPMSIMSQPQLSTARLPPQTQLVSSRNQQQQLQDTHVEQTANTETEPLTALPKKQQQQEQQTTVPNATLQQSSNLPTICSVSHNTAQEDEQYAFAWLDATFERAPATECYIEQQELYRIYITHCQNIGRKSFMSHIQFPRLLRLLYSSSVGPMSVRRSDGKDFPGVHYIGIRLRAQSLPIYPTKSFPLRSKTPDIKLPTKLPNTECTAATSRKLKKKIKPHQEDPKINAVSTKKNESNLQELMSTEENLKDEVTHVADASTAATLSVLQSTPSIVSPSLGLQESIEAATQPSSSLIKSLLANKVTQRQQKNQKECNTATSAKTTHALTMSQGNATTQVNISQQQLQPQSIKVAGTAISALANNQLIQNTPLKVGQTTIKPLNPQNPPEKKPLHESTPPPLAPLSGNNVAKDASGRPVIIANQMLVDILDKKDSEPGIPATIIKRKTDDCNESAKRLALDPLQSRRDDAQVTPSKNAANLYAEMAASILEDEDLEDIPPLPLTTDMQDPSTSTATGQTAEALLNESLQQHQQQILMPTKMQQVTNALQGVQRHLVFQANQTAQLKLATHSSLTQTTELPTAMATIKTDQGLQTIPVILHQKTIEQTQPQQLIQQVIAQNLPQVSPQQQQPTQYVLATNNQGQTYLVAQQSQPPPPTPTQQTVLVTQTPQQQSAGTKTIIILQQQMMAGQQTHQPQAQLIAASGSQKMIMTTPQGQQVLVTQRTQPTLSPSTTQQFLVNPQTGAATPIQQVSVSGGSGITTNAASSNSLLQRHQILPTSQKTTTAAGQISPSLLSQLNHIPATIKLHQPQMPVTTMQSATPPLSLASHQSATISRLGKTVSIMQATPPLAVPPQATPPPIQIPQLQQHQSIIKQHFISGPAEKRQVIFGGRTIEIKETVITQAPPPIQQSQLNAQTIITKQVLSQQHPSMNQQKILPKPVDHPSLIQATLPAKPQIVVQQHTVFTQSPLPLNKTTKAQLVSTSTPQQQATASAGTNTNCKLTGSEPPPLTQAGIRQVIGVQQKEISNEANISPSAGPTTIKFESNPLSPIPQRPQSAPLPGNASQAAETAKAPIQEKLALPVPQLPQVQAPLSSKTNVTLSVDPNWLYVCDWRNCPRRKYKSLADLQFHACSLHCPGHLDPAAEIFCQWGLGPGLCDGIPRKRYSLMTHIIDRHLTTESLQAALQRRISTGTVNLQTNQSPVTIVRNVESVQAQAQRNNIASTATSTSLSASSTSGQAIGIGNATGNSAMHAIKRHTSDYVNPKELMDDNEGPVTKSIRLTSALILRNLVTYNSSAKRSLRRYEPHLSYAAMSNVELMPWLR